MDNMGTVSSGYVARSDGSRVKPFCLLPSSPRTISCEMGWSPQLTCHGYY